MVYVLNWAIISIATIHLFENKFPLVQIKPCRLHGAMLLPEIMKSCFKKVNIKVSNFLTHWGRVTHIGVSKLTIIGSDNGLSPGRRQAIIWTNDGILLIRTFQTYFSEIASDIHTFQFTKMHFKMSSGKWRPSCHGLNVLNDILTMMLCVTSVLLMLAGPDSVCKQRFVVICHQRFNKETPHSSTVRMKHVGCILFVHSITNIEYVSLSFCMQYRVIIQPRSTERLYYKVNNHGLAWNKQKTMCCLQICGVLKYGSAVDPAGPIA